MFFSWFNKLKSRALRSAQEQPTAQVETAAQPTRPIALVVLGSDQEGRWNLRVWKVIVCPLCGGGHVHGAGRADQNHNNFLGSRARHCNASNIEPGTPEGYELVPATPEQVPELKFICKTKSMFHVVDTDGEIISRHRKRAAALRVAEGHPDYRIVNANLEALRELMESTSCE